MGIAISELLMLEYFKGFRVLAGGAGLNREVQGVTVLDAPDSFRWTRGKEMILSCGYVLAQDPDCIARSMQEGFFSQMACMVIKAGRYLTTVPQEMINYFNDNNVPLLEAPFSVAYMELMHEVNTAIMNKTTKRFCITGKDTFVIGDDSYKERKLRKILQAVEADMRFPAMLYDISDNKAYASSINFEKITQAHGIKSSDFWEPVFEHSRHTLCDSLRMVRYRIIEDENITQPKFSWITVPIYFEGAVQAYFVVVESRELIDYYDEYSIRIATLLLQSVFEQLIVARNIGNIGFESLIHFAMSCGESGAQQLAAQAGALNLDINERYYYAVLRSESGDIKLSENREKISDELRRSYMGEAIRFALIEDNLCLIMIKCGADRPMLAGVELHDKIAFITEKLEKCIAAGRFKAGYFAHDGTIAEAARNIERCTQALKLGRLIYPDRNICSYEELGLLAWIKLSEDELDMMCGEYLPLIQDAKSKDLLMTLKAYLSCNMNFSDTAEKMYVHINTIRKRIERINDLLKIDWSDSFVRMKLELLLQILKI